MRRIAILVVVSNATEEEFERNLGFDECGAGLLAESGHDSHDLIFSTAPCWAVQLHPPGARPRKVNHNLLAQPSLSP